MSQDKARDSLSPAEPISSPPLHNDLIGDQHGHGAASFVGMAVGSIGVVYGDIGTSPLYALRESLAHSKATGLTDEAVIGTVSLLLWALFFTVTAKYVLFFDASRQ